MLSCLDYQRASQENNSGKEKRPVTIHLASLILAQEVQFP